MVGTLSSLVWSFFDSISWYRTCGTHCVYDTLSSEQYLRLCQYASRCRCSNHCCVRFSQSIGILWLTNSALGCILSLQHFCCRSESRSTHLLVGSKQRKCSSFNLGSPRHLSLLCSFLTDYFHTAIIMIIACYFSVKAFSTNQIGSVGELFDLVQAAAQRHPVSGNQDGTYLTMTSKSVRAKEMN